MQTSNATQDFGSDDPARVFLAELSLSDFLPDQDWREEPAAGYLLQSLRELGMSPECLESIAGTLTGFAKETVGRAKQGGLEVPGRIRIFCQKKIIDDANAAKPSRPYHLEQGKKQEQLLPDPSANRIGGWGYFTIEKGENVSTGSTLSSENSVDVYLYKEG